MPELCRIVICCDVNRTNFNRTMNLHWAEVRRRHRAAREAARAAWVLAGEPRAEGPVTASLIVRRAQRLDAANIWGAAKAHVDGIFVDALTPDDSPKWLSLGTVTQEIGREWKGREEIEVVVTVGEAVTDCPSAHTACQETPCEPLPIPTAASRPASWPPDWRIGGAVEPYHVPCGARIERLSMGTGRARRVCRRCKDRPEWHFDTVTGRWVRVGGGR